MVSVLKSRASVRFICAAFSAPSAVYRYTVVIMYGEESETRWKFSLIRWTKRVPHYSLEITIGMALENDIRNDIKNMAIDGQLGWTVRENFITSSRIYRVSRASGPRIFRLIRDDRKNQKYLMNNCMHFEKHVFLYWNWTTGNKNDFPFIITENNFCEVADK